MPSPSFNPVFKAIANAIDTFQGKIPSIQQGVLDDILLRLRALDLDSAGNIKTTVANIKIINVIKQRLTKLIINTDYEDAVKEFIRAFDQVAQLQNQYWTSVEATFTPKPLLREIRLQAIDDTVSSLTEAGIGGNITPEIVDILRTNITTGGSYKALEAQLRQSLVDTKKDDGIITKYTKQITTDSINQYSAQYTQAVASGLGFEWYDYSGSEITTSRPFCRAMVENHEYFHISEIPALLEAKGLFYKDPKTGEETPVAIYPKTGLPAGMIEGTNEDNFLIYRGGYNCGHQPIPVSERIVPQADKDRVFNSVAYQKWKSQ